MSIEKDIKQRRPFKSEFHKATINLIYTHNWLTKQLKNYLKPYGCTRQQYNVLRILKGAGRPISTSEIRERMVEKMADTSRLVERLFNKGLVNRQECHDDRRLVDVTISEKGLTFLGEINEIDTYIGDLYSKLNHEELNQLNLILDKIR